MKYIRDTAGFSLGEILMVLAIIGILSAMALPAFFSGQPYRRLKSASRDIYGAMQQARLKAVRENRDTRLRFGAASYYIDENNNGQPDSSENRVDLSVRYNDVQFGSGSAPKTPPAAVTLNSSPSLNSTSLIIFQPDGTVRFDDDNNSNNDLNTVYLENINSQSDSFAVSAQLSGAIKISWYDDGTDWE